MNHSTVALNAPSLPAATTLFVYVHKCRMSINVNKHEHMKTNRVTASSESVSTPFPVRALVTWLEIRKLLVCGFGKILWELRVSLAGVDE